MTKSSNRKLRRLFALQLLLVVVLISLPGRSLIADDYKDRRMHVGLKLFRALVSADLQAASKTAADGSLPIYLVYATSESATKDYQHSLQTSLPKLRNIPGRIEVRALSDAITNTTSKPAAIFITQQLSNLELQQLVQFSIAQNIILFSPFEGDVEKGVLGGLSVEATVRPFINMHTLNASQLEIKSFYLQVAKQYE
jgi:hypothetical protein